MTVQYSFPPVLRSKKEKKKKDTKAARMMQGLGKMGDYKEEVLPKVSFYRKRPN